MDEIQLQQFEEMMAKKLELVEKNQVLLGVTILKKDVYAGKPKLDKEGNSVFDNDGNPVCWDDAYYVECSFMGGKFKSKVTAYDFVLLKENKKYLANGVVNFVPGVNGGQGFLSVSFNKFEYLV